MPCPECGARSQNGYTERSKGRCARCYAKWYRGTEVGKLAIRRAAKRYQASHKAEKAAYIKKWRAQRRAKRDESKQDRSRDETSAGGARG